MISKSRSKLAAGLIGFAMVASAVMPSIASAQSSTDLQAQINSLMATIAALQAQLSSTSGSSSTASTGYTFNTNLTVGSRSADVMNLQKVLNMSADTKVAASGAGSPGMETSTFGPATKAAVIKFQIKNGITPAAGYVGAITRAKLNSMGGVVVVPPVVIPGNPQGGALSVMAGQQPANALAVEKAARVPFTRFVVTAGANDVTINSVTVQRVGQLANSSFAGVVLLNSDGTQIGVAKTLNSNDQAIVGEPWIVRAGTSQTLTVAGNMATDLNDESGQVGGLNVVAVNTSASVSGSLPIMGAQNTINSTLVIGTATGSRGSLDPNATANKEIGTTNFTFSSFKVDAGSQEDVRLWSIRWNQSGSASAADLANVKVIVDGTAYNTTVSTDGKYYSAAFPGGLLIGEGLSKEISIKGDIVGGTNRTVALDIYKATDIYLTGETFGYGISPASGTGFTSTATPAYDAVGVVTITAGSASTISSSNTVGAQNIAILVADQPLGGFEVRLRGEGLEINEMIFDLFADNGSVEDITNIKLVNQNGVVLAGPEDGVTTAGEDGTVTFNNVTLSVGDSTLRLVGRLNSDFEAGDTVQASTTPSSQWVTPRGVSTGDTVDLSSFSSAVQGNLMTVRAGALAVTASTQPSARQVIAGAQGFEFARIVLDAGQSGEDIRLSTIKAFLALTTITAAQLSSCGVFDGATNLTDATNLTVAAGSNTFTFNNGGYVVSKGTSKTLSLKCNTSAGATSGDIKWGIQAASYGSSYTGATGVTSGLTIAESVSENLGQLMTAATSGTYTVTADSAVLYKIAQAGTSNVELAKFRFTGGATEAVDLKQIALVLGNTASSSPADLVGERVTLWNGATQIGTAQFSSSDYATSTVLSPAPRIAAGESVVITVKGDLSAQNINEGTPGAFLAVSYDGNNSGLNGNYGTGVSSQITVAGGTSGAVTTNGLRIFRTVPTIAVTSNGGTLAAGADLYKFTVTNPNSRDVVFKKFTFSVATTSGAVSGFILYGDGVAFNSTTNAIGSDGSAVIEAVAAVTSQAKMVPANSSKTYILKATTATDTASVSETIGLALLADTSYPVGIGQYMGSATEIDSDNAADIDNIIWSPFSTTTPEATSATESNLDWTNGYGLPGFPSNTAFPVQTWTREN